MNTKPDAAEHVVPWCPNCEDRDPCCMACAGEGYRRNAKSAPPPRLLKFLDQFQHLRAFSLALDRGSICDTVDGTSITIGTARNQESVDFFNRLFEEARAIRREMGEI